MFSTLNRRDSLLRSVGTRSCDQASLLTIHHSPPSSLRPQLFAMPLKLNRTIGRAKVLFKQLQAELKTQLLADIELFRTRAGKAVEGARDAARFNKLSNAQKHARSAQQTMDELRVCCDEAVELGRHEELFGIEASDFSYVASTREQLEPIALLWQLASDWSVNKEDWLDGELLQLQPYVLHLPGSNSRNAAKPHTARL